MLRPASSARPPTRAAAAPAPCELDYSLHAYLAMMAIVAVNSDIDVSDLERISGPDVMELMRIGRNFTTARSAAQSEESGLGELVRDYSRAFHTSVGELRRERLTDFLMEYYEAAEEAKRQRDKAASMPRNNFRKYRRR